MKKIAVFLKPFSFSQTIIVYENGNKLSSSISSMNSLDSDILRIAHKENIKDVDIITGSKAFAKKIVEDIEKADIAKYDKSTIKINLI